MLVRVGRRGEPTDTPGALIRACHDRLRFFTGLASRLATEPSLSDAEVREAAERIHRYFTEALPHHEADEDESVAPRLRGRSAEMDEALDRVAEEHRASAIHVERIVRMTAELAAEPGRRATLRTELRGIADTLLGFYQAHMAQEEQVVVEALERCLDSVEQQAILAEMRARRAARGPVAAEPRAPAGTGPRKAV